MPDTEDPTPPQSVAVPCSADLLRSVNDLLLVRGATGVSAAEICEVVSEYLAEAQRSKNIAVNKWVARLKIAEDELRNIANAKTSTWDEGDDFQAWAQNRARHALNSRHNAAAPARCVTC